MFDGFSFHLDLVDNISLCLVGGFLRLLDMGLSSFRRRSGAWCIATSVWLKALWQLARPLILKLLRNVVVKVTCPSPLARTPRLLEPLRVVPALGDVVGVRGTVVAEVVVIAKCVKVRAGFVGAGVDDTRADWEETDDLGTLLFRKYVPCRWLAEYRLERVTVS